MYRSVVFFAVFALMAASPGRAAPDVAPWRPHYRARLPYYRLTPLPRPAPITPQPAPPPLHIHNRPFNEGEPLPYPEELGPGPTPSLPSGMMITVTKNLGENPDDKPQPDDQGRKAISLPKQAAEQLLTCWNPPLPAKGEENEVTLRFAFNRGGSVIGGSPRITFVKAGQGVKPDDLRKSIISAFKSCTPLNFSASMASSMPGYPLSVRFIGRRAQD